MKIQLDTTRKTMTIEEDIKLGNFVDLVKELLPDNEWKQYTLVTDTKIINWEKPIIMPFKTYDPFDWRKGGTLGSPIYNVEVRNE